MNKRGSSGFTLIEVLVVVVVIAVLASISFFGSSIIQANARDEQRNSNATVISEALEKYYLRNGEYPSVPAVTNTNADSVKQVLGITDTQVLVMPKATTGTTNSIKLDAPSSTVLRYDASSTVNDSQCKNDVAGGCDQWTITYVTESNETVTIDSRQSGRSNEFATPPVAPATPVLTAEQQGTNIVAQSAVSCSDSGLVLQHSFQRKVGSAGWSGWGAWTETDEASYSGNTDGVIYQFQSKARCMNGVTPGAESSPSNIAQVTYTAPLETPPAPATTATISGSNAVGTAATVSCTVGTTQYRMQSRGSATSATGSWSAWSTWSTAQTLSVAANQGYRYGFQSQARCIRDANTSTASVSGVIGQIVRDITAPAAPVVSGNTSGGTTSYTYTNVTCPTGTSARYQYKYWGDWSGGDGAWYGPYTSLAFSGRDTTSQGWEYRLYMQAHCFTVHTTSPWSVDAYSSYVRPVDGPSGITFSIAKPNAGTVHVIATSSCHPSVDIFSRADTHTWDIVWSDSRQLGWYGDSHGGIWTLHNWGHYGNTFLTGSSRPSGQTMPSGSRWNMAVDMACRNYTTGRLSGTTGRIDSQTMVLP